MAPFLKFMSALATAAIAAALAFSCLTASCDEGRAKWERKVGAQSGVHWGIRVIAFGLLGV